MKDIEYVARLNLKPDCNDRAKLMRFCLFDENRQYLAIGWSIVYETYPTSFDNYTQYLSAVKEYSKAEKKRVNSAVYLFEETEEGDLFWTRDLQGFYWICRATGKAEPFYDKDMDIGALLPVKAYCYGLDVPGQIKSAFNRPNGGIAQRMYERIIIEFSKHAFNEKSGNDIYTVDKRVGSNIIENLPDLELEELVISYVQIKYNYYLLSNSIAAGSTTVSIECEFRSRDIANPQRAVVQVKGPKNEGLDALDYHPYINKGYHVFLYAPIVYHTSDTDHLTIITRNELTDFYQSHKSILPESITRWECLLE